MIKNLSELQSNAKYASFAMRLTEALRSNNIEPTPSAVVSAFNKVHMGRTLKAHTVRKWLIGEAKPRYESMVLITEWLKFDTDYLTRKPGPIRSVVDIDFTDQEVITKYLSMNVKQKAAVSLLIDTILDKAK